MPEQLSPISRQLCDGLFYWDSISFGWFRLIDRASQDVVGSYRVDSSYPASAEVQLQDDNPANFPQNKRFRVNSDYARRRVEQYCAVQWIPSRYPVQEARA